MKAAALKPDDINAYVYWGGALNMMDRFLEADQVFRKAGQDQPERSAAEQILGQCGI